MNYATLVSDIQKFTEDDGDKFQAALPRIISNAMTIISRALPLQMYEKIQEVSLTPNRDKIIFSQLTHPIAPVTVDSLIMSTGEIVERRSPAYIQMFRGTGTPLYFCDIEGGLRIAPVPFRSLVANINYLSRPELSEENPTNWYVTTVYDLVFKVCLMEAHEFLIEPAMVQVYQQDFSTLITLAVREHQDMLRSSAYHPLATSASTTPKE